MSIVVVPATEWSAGKLDPTEYDYETSTIRVRDDYPLTTDPAGWIVHEQAHATLHRSATHKDDGKPYPFNNTERLAYTMQFLYLINQGYILFEAILSIPTWRHKEVYRDPLARYFEDALRRVSPIFRLPFVPLG